MSCDNAEEKKQLKGISWCSLLMRILSPETNLPCVSVKCVFLFSYLFFGSLNFGLVFGFNWYLRGVRSILRF